MKVFKQFWVEGGMHGGREGGRGREEGGGKKEEGGRKGGGREETINLSTVIIYIFSFVLLLFQFQFQTLTISDLSKSNNFEEVYEEVNIMVAY